MSKPCEKEEHQRGLDVEVRSGNGGTVNCQVNLGNNNQHIVSVRNKKTYRVDIVCEGFIDSDRNRVKFQSPNGPPDSDIYWVEKASLEDGEERIFGQIPLVPVCQGDENVHTKVHACWKQPIKRTTISLGIQVTA